MNVPPDVSLPAAAAVSGGRRWHVRLSVVLGLLAIFPSFSVNRLRMLGLRICGVRAGHATFFWGLPRLVGSGAIAARLRIGSFCGFNAGCEFDLEAPITIGDYVAVGHRVRFLTSKAADGTVAPAAITIGDGVWLGARCTVLGGVTVGAGTVIGAGVTVSADVPPNTLLSGAKPISLAKWR